MRRGWPATLATLRTDLERQVVDPLAQVVVLPLQLVLRLVDPAAQLAHLILQRIDPGQQAAPADRCRRIVLRRRRIGRLPVAAATAARDLVLQRLQLLAKLVDLVLQRDALAAVHLGMAGATGCGQQKGRHDERSNDEPHAGFLNMTVILSHVRAAVR